MPVPFLTNDQIHESAMSFLRKFYKRCASWLHKGKDQELIFNKSIASTNAQAILEIPYDAKTC